MIEKKHFSSKPLRNLYLSKNYYASIQNDNLLTKQICCQKSLVQKEKLQKQQQKH